MKRGWIARSQRRRSSTVGGGITVCDQLGRRALDQEAGRLAVGVALDLAAGRVRGRRRRSRRQQRRARNQRVVRAPVEEDRPPARRRVQLGRGREAPLGEELGIDPGPPGQPLALGVGGGELAQPRQHLGDALAVADLEFLGATPAPQHVDVGVDHPRHDGPG